MLRRIVRKGQEPPAKSIATDHHGVDELAYTES